MKTAETMPATHDEDMLGLSPGLLYLWTIPHDRGDTVLANRLEAILSADERNQARRFHRDEDRRLFVAARAFVRLALSRHFSIPPEEWFFTKDRNGKPLIAKPVILRSVHFSLSHTEGLIACLISLSAEAAVDVEKHQDGQALVLAARQVLSSTEHNSLSMSAGDAWASRFFAHWTLKEAYAKARGLGLSLPLSEISFELNPSEKISAHFGPGVDDDASGWLFWCCTSLPQHTLAIAAKRDRVQGFGLILQPVQFKGLSIVPDPYSYPSRPEFPVRMMRGSPS